MSSGDDRILAMILPHVVLDTNICLDLFVFRDPACKKLYRSLKEQTLKAVTNEICRSEWLRVLEYSKIPLDSVSRPECIAEFDTFVYLIEPAELSNIILPSCSDADDQKFLELARDSKACSLITKDKALLKLSRKVAAAGLFQIVPPLEWNKQFYSEVTDMMQGR